jgi:hypothetical protein
MSRIFKSKLRLPHLWVPLLICVVAGCGKGGPDLAPVTGRVTLDGRPLESVDVVFQPTNGNPPSTTRTDADGHYEMLYKRGLMGARVGEHTVRIGFTSNIVTNPPNIPAKYNMASELRREVKSGANELDFELTSEGK